MNIFLQSFFAFMIHLASFKSLGQTSVHPITHTSALIVTPEEVNF